jgi:hypothetical protein
LSQLLGTDNAHGSGTWLVLLWLSPYHFTFSTARKHKAGRVNGADGMIFQHNDLADFERKRAEIARRNETLHAQLRQLEALTFGV